MVLSKIHYTSVNTQPFKAMIATRAYYNHGEYPNNTNLESRVCICSSTNSPPSDSPVCNLHYNNNNTRNNVIMSLLILLLSFLFFLLNFSLYYKSNINNFSCFSGCVHQSNSSNFFISASLQEVCRMISRWFWKSGRNALTK